MCPKDKEWQSGQTAEANADDALPFSRFAAAASDPKNSSEWKFSPWACHVPTDFCRSNALGAGTARASHVTAVDLQVGITKK